MIKKSIFDVIGRAEAFRLTAQAVVAAAKRNKEAGLMTASHVNGQTVFSSPEIEALSKAGRQSRAKVQRFRNKTGR